MIHLYDYNGAYTTYGIASGIKVILEYKCMDKEGNKVNVYVACPDESYADNWIYQNEWFDEFDGWRKFRANPTWCRSTLKLINRNYINIDWNLDYHFYPDKDKMIVDTSTKSTNHCRFGFLDL